MFRKVASIICLVLGGVFIMTIGMASFVMFERDAAMGAVVTLIYLALATPFTLGGMALWGWRRWRITLGIVLTAVGGMLAMCAVTLPLVTMSPEWKKIADPNVEAVLPPLIAGSVIFGVICLVAGVALIIGQKRRDKAAATSTRAEQPGEFTTTSEDTNRDGYE